MSFEWQRINAVKTSTPGQSVFWRFGRYMIIWLKYISIHVYNILYFKTVWTDYQNMKNVLIFINIFLHLEAMLQPHVLCMLFIHRSMIGQSFGGIQYGETPWISLSKGLDRKLIMAIDLDKKGSYWKLLASDLERKQTAWHAYTRQLSNGWFHQLSIPDIKGINQRTKLTLHSLAGPKLGLNCTYSCLFNRKGHFSIANASIVDTSDQSSVNLYIRKL